MDRAESSADVSAGRLAAAEASAEPESVTEPRSTSVVFAGAAEAEASAVGDAEGGEEGTMGTSTQVPFACVKPVAQPQTAFDVAVQAAASVWRAPSQVAQAAQGAAPLALKVLPGTQLPGALEMQTPPVSVKPAAQPQTAFEVVVQAEATVCCAPLQEEHIKHEPAAGGE